MQFIIGKKFDKTLHFENVNESNYFVYYSGQAGDMGISGTALTQAIQLAKDLGVIVFSTKTLPPFAIIG